MTAICQTGEMTRTLDRLPRSRSSSRQLRSPRAASDLAFKWRVCVGRHYSPGISQGKVNNQYFRHTQSEFGRFLMRGPWGGPGNWSRSRCGMRIHDCVKRMRQEQHSILPGRGRGGRGINKAIPPKRSGPEQLTDEQFESSLRTIGSTLLSSVNCPLFERWGG